MRIVLNIDEGQKYYYRNIEWIGNYKYNDSTLTQVLGIERGDVYNPAELEKRLNFSPTDIDITSMYMDDGYLFFSIQPVEVEVEGDSIDVQMRIFEGDQANINKVIVMGNTKTSDHVVYRELRTQPGQKFRRSDLIRSQRELASLGYFDPETIGIQPQPNVSDGTVDILYTVEEKASDQIELSGGWGGPIGFIGTLGLTFNNFSLRNITDFSKYSPLPAGDGQRLSLRMQANGRFFQTYSFSLTEPWLGGKRRNTFTVNLSHSRNGQIEPGSVRIGGRMTVSGITLALGRSLNWPDDFFSLTNSLNIQQYNLRNFDLRRIIATGGNASRSSVDYPTFGDSYNLTFNTTLARNSIDNPTFPRRGASISLSLTLTPPYSILQNDFTDRDVRSERFRLVEYHKWMFDNSWFFPITDKLVFNTRMNFGMLGTYGTGKGIGPFDRFIMGGDGLAQNNFFVGADIIGLRGYENRSIFGSASQEGGLAYSKFVTELRYAISLNPAATVYVHAFAEAGNNWDKVTDFNPFNMYRSAGVGARVFMPAFGLLGVDWGYGFDDIPYNPGRNGRQFHFTIGQQIR